LVDRMLNEWKDVDSALRKCAQLDATILAAAVRRDEAILAATRDYDNASKAKVEQRLALTAEIEDFCRAHRKELDGDAWTGNFGKAGFRLNPPKVVALKGWTMARILEALEAARMDELLRVKKELDKTACHRVDEDTLRKVGVKIVHEETFFVETVTA
jgi:phage host-nuclease inhibitor protein Gam